MTTMNMSHAAADAGSNTTALIARRFAQIIVQILVQATLLFACAGRIDWGAGWAYMGIFLALLAVNATILLSGHKELIAERAQIKEGSKGWDKAITAVVAVLSMGLLAVAGLDIRFGSSPPPALAVQAVAALAIVLGFAFFSWAMASNPYFSTVVRIQEERHHQVATGGPYRFVRHPGYAGMLVYTLATPMLLGSRWALLPAVAACILVVVRTALEDRTLMRELEGYVEYAGRVRYRLLPGVY